MRKSLLALQRAGKRPCQRNYDKVSGHLPQAPGTWRRVRLLDSKLSSSMVPRLASHSTHYDRTSHKPKVPCALLCAPAGAQENDTLLHVPLRPTFDAANKRMHWRCERPSVHPGCAWDAFTTGLGGLHCTSSADALLPVEGFHLI